MDRSELAQPGKAIPQLFPAPRNPYYIVAPAYVRTSAGIKALHLLCHWLNRIGERAYLIVHPRPPVGPLTHPDLLTPILTKQIAEFDFERQLAPITVYPESIAGNPLRAPFVVRYVMNFPGLLGGDTNYAPDEMRLGYSQILAEAADCPDNVLFIPTSDPVLFTPEPVVERRGTCFYAGKHKYFHEGELSPVTEGSTEITRDRPESQSPAEIAELFRRSELFYCYENSALAIEALLCGCPVVFLPNKYFGRVIAERELGCDGVAWGTEPSEIAHAQATASLARDRYLATYELFWKQLGDFVAQTQRNVLMARYEKPVKLPALGMGDYLAIIFHVRLGRHSAYEWFSISRFVLRNYGWRAFFRKASRRIVTTLFGTTRNQQGQGESRR